ncbi:MAG: hypothetical protein EBT45_07765 [Alphaproteobacteria bacterium]|nr:hypothetical protein [Alphaproteobacteria bacterium]
MKKLLSYLLIATMFASCAVPEGMSAYQAHNVAKFNRKKHYRTSAGPRYVRPKKRGNIMHPAVKRETRKEQIRRIKAHRYTVSN